MTFILFDDRGDPVREYRFDHIQGDGVPGVVTSVDTQGLNGLIVGDQGASSLLDLADARLFTLSNQEAPPTIPQPDWPIRLVLGGFVFGQWTVRFESPVDSFDIDGRWGLPPQP
ncbi:hypothetical protein ACFVJ5_07000 [Nocardia sp. NPDC127606]|uniref:hypothetical protein n=1 Tax=Nocardia sp. NPDC127606 TaxID=3345406 RepID=UPI003634CA6A